MGSLCKQKFCQGPSKRRIWEARGSGGARQREMCKVGEKSRGSGFPWEKVLCFFTQSKGHDREKVCVCVCECVHTHVTPSSSAHSTPSNHANFVPIRIRHTCHADTHNYTLLCIYTCMDESINTDVRGVCPMRLGPMCNSIVLESLNKTHFPP